MKIVSLIPSATEIIASLDLLDNLVSVSHECDNPKEVTKLPKLTKSNIKIKQASMNIHEDIKKILELGLSVYEVKSNLLKKLNPEVIITQSQCSVCAVSLNDPKNCLGLWLGNKPKLIDLKPNTFDDILNDIKNVGNELNVKKKSDFLIKKFKKNIFDIKKKLDCETKNVLCIEWLEPLMIAGNWIPNLLNFSNAKNILGIPGKHSTFIKIEEIPVESIDIIIFMPCGYDINKTEQEIKSSNYSFMKAFKNKKKFIVDGNKYFNRPGPSILESINILCEIIHPNIFSPNPSYERWIEF